MADNRDIAAYLQDVGETDRKSHMLLERFARLERCIINSIPDNSLQISCKQLNDNAINDGITTSKEKDIRTLLYFLSVKGYTHKKEDGAHNLMLERLANIEETLTRIDKRLAICRYAIDWLYRLAKEQSKDSDDKCRCLFPLWSWLSR